MAKLFDEASNEVIFADWNGKFTEWYKDRTLKSAAVKIMRSRKFYVRKRNVMSKTFVKSILQYANEYKFFKNFLSNIAKFKPDVILFTSLGETGLSLIRNINTPILVVIHTLKRISLNYSFKEKPIIWLKQQILNKINKSFMERNSAGIIVLESTLEDMVSSLRCEVIRIPYELFDEDDLDCSADLEKLNSEFTVTSVGEITSNKNIEFVLEAIKDVDNPFFKYRLCGKISGKYGEKIKKLISESYSEVETFFEYLSEKKFKEEFVKTNFVVIPYSKNRQDQASGILFDSMKYNRPVIVPNVEPFVSYINKYNIGISYNEGDYSSFINAIKEAKKLGTEHFIENIKQFKRDHTYTKWRPTFLSFVDKIIKNKGGTI